MGQLSPTELKGRMKIYGRDRGSDAHIARAQRVALDVESGLRVRRENASASQTSLRRRRKVLAPAGRVHLKKLV